MKKTLKTLVLAAALGGAALVAMAQPMGSHDGMMGQGRHSKMDTAKMEAMVAKRADALKAQLKLSPEQEAAWKTYVAAMKPAAKAMPQHPSREELSQLTTPERIDKMRALRDQQHKDMQVAMEQRDQATKTFYATLSAEQKKTFDAQHLRMAGDHGRKGPHGPMGKDGKQAPKQQ
jgi:hypothetical protein